MTMKSFYIVALFTSGAFFVSCTDYEVKDPNFMPPDVVLNEDPKYNEIIEGLPEPGKMQAYKPSLIGKPYRPITVNYSSEFKPVSRWTPGDTRIVAYMADYEPQVLTEEDYKAITNKYGSLTTGIKFEATGRFHVTKGLMAVGGLLIRKAIPVMKEVLLRYVMVALNVIVRHGWNVLVRMRIGWLLHKQSWHLSAFTVRELSVRILMKRYRPIIWHILMRR